MQDKSIMTAVVDLSSYVDTQYFGERPHVRGRRVPVATIAYNARENHWDVAELAYQPKRKCLRPSSITNNTKPKLTSRKQPSV